MKTKQLKSKLIVVWGVIFLLFFSNKIISQEYYKITLSSKTIYLDYASEPHTDYLGNPYSVNKYEYIPYVDGDKSEYKNQTSYINEVLPSTKLFGDEIVKVYEVYGHYGKVIAYNKDTEKDAEWWIDMYNFTKLTDLEVQEYLKDQNDEQSKAEFFNNISNIYNNSPTLFWLLIGVIVFVFILIVRFFVRLSQRCKVCGKWGAVKKVNSHSDLRDTTSTTTRKSEQITDIYGKKHTNYYHVPATRRTYDHLDKYECKYCGNKTEKRYTSSDTTED